MATNTSPDTSMNSNEVFGFFCFLLPPVAMREIILRKKGKNRTQSAVHKGRPNIQWFPLHVCVCLADINLPVAFQNKRSAVVHKKAKKVG